MRREEEHGDQDEGIWKEDWIAVVYKINVNALKRKKKCITNSVEAQGA